VTVTANYTQSTVHVSFTHSGLNHINSGITVLTIDDVTYDYWEVQNTNFQWVIGSTHTVTAASSLSSWETPPTQYSFVSWTNGNGLTSTSGTFTTPSTPEADVVVTANYAESGGEPATTALTITCAPTTVGNTGTEVVSITGTLTSASVGVAGKTITLSYYDGAWTTI
jgi:uncharacterized repeat protein (TIGR02543 family)